MRDGVNTLKDRTAGWCASITFNTLEEMRRGLARLIFEVNRHLVLSDDMLFDFRLVISELAINAIQYGKKPVRIMASQCCTGDVHVLVQNQSSVSFLFCPDAFVQQTPSPEQTQGRGIYLAKQLSAGLAYSSTNNKVLVRFSFH